MKHLLWSWKSFDLFKQEQLIKREEYWAGAEFDRIINRKGQAKKQHLRKKNKEEQKGQARKGKTGAGGHRSFVRFPLFIMTIKNKCRALN